MISLFIIYCFILFLAYGSFLNVVAYRLIHGISIVRPRSFCPACKTTLAWYDLIPVLSWFMLNAQCRACGVTISWLYPCIELLTALVFTVGMFRIEPRFWLSSGLLASALIITIRTDLEYMLISRYTTTLLIPVAYILSFFNLLPITLIESIAGSIVGYGILWAVAYVFYKLRKRQGIGEGDFDLLATIGAFTGITGVWVALLLGALTGSLYSIYLVLRYKVSIQTTRIPFGPWLCAGALLYLLYDSYIVRFLL